jgi:hypothetical protein
MNNITCELKKLDEYRGVECAKKIHQLYLKYPDYTTIIDKYIENRVYTVIASADKIIDSANFQIEDETLKELPHLFV